MLIAEAFFKRCGVNIVLPACLLTTVLGCGLSQPSSVVEWQGPTMGTQWQITLGTQNPAISTLRNAESETSQALQQAVTEELERINGLMSTWDPNSELSRFNAWRSLEPIQLHADTLAVLNQAQAVAEASDGAYDVTRGNVFKLWGFSADQPQPEAPSQTAIDAALAQSGWQSINVTANTVAKRFPNTTIDLSSLAKGYAVDQLGELLEKQGVEHYVVNIGGEIRTRGERSENRAWHIGVEQPNSTVPTGIALNRAHLATSGSYRNVRIIDGVRVSHLIDGRTGQPISHALVAVTVLHESTLLADAWATAFMVMGPERARTYAEQQQLAVQLTLLDETQAALDRSLQYSLWSSPEWQGLPLVELP